MPDGRYPAAVWQPGVNAGYAAGKATMESVVCHTTVGRNSAPIGQRGYFNFLVSRDGTVTQFAEADAICWHAGMPWNTRGPGIEIEYLDEPTVFTPEALDATKKLCRWITETFGVPQDFYDGPRIDRHNGFITHRSLIQTGDSHTDYWPDDAAAVIFHAPIPAPPGAPIPHRPEEPMLILINADQPADHWLIVPGKNWAKKLSVASSDDLHGQGVPRIPVPGPVILDWSAG